MRNLAKNRLVDGDRSGEEKETKEKKKGKESTVSCGIIFPHKNHSKDTCMGNGTPCPISTSYLGGHHVKDNANKFSHI